MSGEENVERPTLNRQHSFTQARIPVIRAHYPGQTFENYNLYASLAWWS
ncbi:hypothetical protein DES42_1207 [Zavarzinia compransoris]|nr:hypothetical protein DES42_1207 [Zavarzinia compransoris]